MTNRTWLAVVLCCLVWFVYMRWFAPAVPSPVSAPAVTSKTAPAEETLSQGAGIPVGKTPSLAVFSSRPSQVEVARLTSPHWEVVFGEGGGKMSTIRLLDFNQTLKADAPKIETLEASSMPHSLGSFFTKSELAPFGFAPYQKRVSEKGIRLERSEGGIRVIKGYAPTGGDYFFDETMEIHFPSRAQDWGYLLVPVGGQGLVSQQEDPLHAWEAVAYQDDSITRKKWEDIEEGQQVIQGNTRWVAFGNRYFSNVVVNESSLNPDVVFEKSAEFTGVYLRYPLVVKPSQSTVSLKFKIYSGPKEYSELNKVPGMRQLIDYGMFSFLAYPLLELLRFFNRFLHNYGLAIILLTIVVRVLFYPLSLKSYRSMKAMQKLQPQIQALKEKYKDDTQRFGQEQMALFRAHKVNPAGGCLPVLVQLPVFIALYAVLQNSIELFHAPLYGWIKDLSSKDPFYVFPVLMGISMFVQQKMTPPAGMDATQQKIMLLMPIIFSAVMLNLPSGLTMYIFISTLLGILQQLLMNREQNKTNGQLVTAPQPSRSK